MSEETLNNAFLAILSASGLISTILGWYARQHWLVKKGIQVAMLVVDKLDDEMVHPIKQANKDVGLRYDLTPEQGKAVMEEAKLRVSEVAKLEDKGLPAFFPSVEKSLQDPAKVERIIETVVQQRKGRKLSDRPRAKGKPF